MVIEVLFFDGCPGHEQLLPGLRRLASAVGAELRPLRVETPEHAQAQRFLGSPTVRVDGLDVEPGARSRTDYGLKCRLYQTPAGLVGAPPEDWVREALAAEATHRIP